MALPHDPWPTRFVIPPAKIVDYLLNPDHEDGASKCAYLSSYGFDRGAPQLLYDALLLHACPENFESVVTAASGALKYLFAGPVPSPVGRDAHLLSI